MSRIGRWLSSKINTYITGIIESRINERIQSLLYAPSGDDSPPLPGDRILIFKVDGTGNYAISGILTKSQGAEPGEKKLYSRDSNGDVQAVIYLKGDGTIEINGNANFAVSWTDLNAALQALVTAINATFATKADAAGAAGTLTLDLSGAKVSEVKLP